MGGLVINFPVADQSAGMHRLLESVSTTPREAKVLRVRLLKCTGSRPGFSDMLGWVIMPQGNIWNQLISFADARSEVEKFETVLATYGIHIAPGSDLELVATKGY